jgi:hypothetical protein
MIIHDDKLVAGFDYYITTKVKRKSRSFNFNTTSTNPFYLTKPEEVLPWIKNLEANLRWLSKYTPKVKDKIYEPKIMISIKTKDRYF